ncbi:MAG TPA: hypothetical protein VJ417_04745 [Candidatus Glassbacteria bacterium]|nr:hypothetical protein [Candidatus Glassbacteria bacterium]
MRYLVLLAGLVFLFSVSALDAQKSKTDFSGKWALNTEKSDLGDMSSGRRGGLPSSKLNVEQKDNMLMVESFRTNQDGVEESMKSTYSLDGKECKNEGTNRSSVSTATWSEDGKLLTIISSVTMSRSGQEFSMKVNEVWSLAEGALSIKATRTTQRGERTTTAVYNKS